MEELILFLFLVHVKCQLNDFPDQMVERPDKCTASAEFMYRPCCVFPPFFVRDIAKFCGAMSELKFIDRKYDVKGLRRIANSRCDYWWCLLNQYGLVNSDNETLNSVKYYNHLDKWAQYNPDFNTVIPDAKNHCNDLYRNMFPINICNFFNFQQCVRNYITTDCPTTIPSEECLEKKKFYDECRIYFI